MVLTRVGTDACKTNHGAYKWSTAERKGVRKWHSWEDAIMFSSFRKIDAFHTNVSAVFGLFISHEDEERINKKIQRVQVNQKKSFRGFDLWFVYLPDQKS